MIIVVMGSDDNLQSAETHAARCPRCGYDQRGVMAQWTESCALEGRCAECGLDYRWAELLVPEKFEPLWCVEFARGRCKVLRSCFGTLWRALWPWRFWKQLNMSHDVRWLRLAVLVLFMVALFGLAYVLEQTAVAVRVRMIVAQQIEDEYPTKEEAIVLHETQIANLESILDNSEGWYSSKEQREARLARARRTLATLKTTEDIAPRINYPLHLMIYEATCKPTSSLTSGSIDVGVFGTDAYPSPSIYHEFVAQYVQNVPTWKFDPIPFVVPSALYLGLAVTLAVCIPLAFILLPVSRRRAKVRWRHIWRVAVYTSCVALSLVFILFLAAMVVFLIPGSLDRITTYLLVAGFLPTVAITVSWAVAIRRYLRMPHGWAIVVLFSVLSVLAVGAVTGLLGALLQSV